MEAITASLRNTLGSSTKIFSTVEAATAAAAQDGEGKCWVVLQQSAGSLAEVHTALQSGIARLCVVIVPVVAPVSQMDVLRAMEYGGVYVAAAEISAAAPVISEAASYDRGAAFLLLAPSNLVQNDARWTAFRYDTRREEGGNSAFVSDGSAVRKEIQGFVDRDNLLTLVASKALPAEGEGAEESGNAEGAGDASKTVTILYTSDTGHGEECAKAIARQCRSGGYASSAVRCGTMDSFDVGTLASEPLIVFCVATAGKGEFPGNGRNFW